MRPHRHHAAAHTSNCGRAALVLLALVVLVGAAIFLLGPRTGPGGPGATGRTPVDDALARERVDVHFAKQNWDEARKAIAPLIDGDDSEPEDLLRAAQIELAASEAEAARAFLDRALTIAPADAGVRYLRARLLQSEGRYEGLEEAYEIYLRLHEENPDDYATRLGLAAMLYELEIDGWEEKALELYDGIISEGVEVATSWYITAVYRRSQLTYEVGTPEEGRQYQDLWKSLADAGYKALESKDLDQGTLAPLGPPEPNGFVLSDAPELPTYGESETILPELANATHLQVRDINGDRRPDFLAIDPAGVALAVAVSDGYVVQRPFTGYASGAVAAVAALDLNQERSGDSLDLVALMVDGTLALVEQVDETSAPLPVWEASPVSLPVLEGGGADLVPVDFDHDGDLDLFVVGGAGARLLRNDGAGVRLGEADPETKIRPLLPRGEWVDASEEASLPRSPLTWCATEDFDADQDVDLLCGGPNALHLMSSLRRGLFEDIAEAAFGDAFFASEPALADLDGDGRVDLVVPNGVAGANATLWTQPDTLRFVSQELSHAIPAGPVPNLCDLDLDGATDLAWASADGKGRALLAAGVDVRAAFDLPTPDDASGLLLVADIDTPDAYGLLAEELVRVTPEGLAVHRATDGVGNGVHLKFFGNKDNRQGVGAILEVRARELYRRIYLRGEGVLVGLGENDELDIVRVTWPNGVVQRRLDVEKGVDVAGAGGKDWVQPESIPGSCPFLYTWNGETFTFVSDVLGITPLGLPMAPQMMVPPDHDEYVLVTAEQLVPDENGEYVLQFTEELREVTYLDRVRLDVVDHPASSEVFPDERFCFPPFATGRLHTMEGALAPVQVTGSDGADWTAALTAQDDDHAAPFERYGGQYLGLATPHHLELEFDPEAVAGTTRHRLLCTGWFMWSDASVNMAAARTPGIEFVPPIVEVPDGNGGWRPIGPPVGFPAGKTKSMIVELTGHLDPADPRVRIGSTLELYWDRIALAVCDDDAERRVTSLEPKSAELWMRGFSRPTKERVDLPERFVWDDIETEPRWNQHPGLYTRLGDCLELTGDIDDRFVIMGAGDCLTLRFDATTLPPLPEGWRRDFLVFLDGWAKDRDPNTIQALEVEPLPFHGMSGYPYGADESFPDTPEHRRWREEWNTRPAYDWIVPLAPSELGRWLDPDSIEAR